MNSTGIQYSARRHRRLALPGPEGAIFAPHPPAQLRRRPRAWLRGGPAAPGAVPGATGPGAAAGCAAATAAAVALTPHPAAPGRRRGLRAAQRGRGGGCQEDEDGEEGDGGEEEEEEDREEAAGARAPPRTRPAPAPPRLLPRALRPLCALRSPPRASRWAAQRRPAASEDAHLDLSPPGWIFDSGRTGGGGCRGAGRGEGLGTRAPAAPASREPERPHFAQRGPGGRGGDTRPRSLPVADGIPHPSEASLGAEAKVPPCACLENSRFHLWLPVNRRRAASARLLFRPEKLGFGWGSYFYSTAFGGKPEGATKKGAEPSSGVEGAGSEEEALLVLNPETTGVRNTNYFL